ncbi:DUF6343 family protein [Modestobacter sp. SYSU DS0875]
MSEPHKDRSRTEYEQGLPDHHDPTAGIGGAAPARSALTLRLVLAAFGLVICTVFGIIALNIDQLPVVFPIVLFVLAAVALVDLVVVARRKLRGEPG